MALNLAMTCFTLVVFYAKGCIERNAIKIADILHKKPFNENELDDKNDEKSYGEKISN